MTNAHVLLMVLGGTALAACAPRELEGGSAPGGCVGAKCDDGSGGEAPQRCEVRHLERSSAGSVLGRREVQIVETARVVGLERYAEPFTDGRGVLESIERRLHRDGLVVEVRTERPLDGGTTREQRGYDDQRRLVRIEAQRDGRTDYVAERRYDARGNAVWHGTDNGVDGVWDSVLAMGYDDDRLVTLDAFDASGQLDWAYRLSYGAGRVARMDADGGGKHYTKTFSYDAAGRYERITWERPGGVRTVDFDYDTGGVIQATAVSTVANDAPLERYRLFLDARGHVDRFEHDVDGTGSTLRVTEFDACARPDLRRWYVETEQATLDVLRASPPPAE